MRHLRSPILQTLLVTLLFTVFVQAADPPDVSTYTGSFADGATYLIQVPSNWNGTLVLYSHGYNAGPNNPAYDVGDGTTGYVLLVNGFALAGSSYATTGWAVREAIPDQMQVLATFRTIAGNPQRTIAWGHSMGGLITAALAQQYPDYFQAAIPMCGVVGGGVGTWNQFLDPGYALNTLMGAGSGLQVVNISNPTNNINIANGLLYDAQLTAQGRARIALIAALADVPGWFDSTLPPPAPTDYVTQEGNQYDWLGSAVFPFTFYYRAEMESRAGGNPSFNTGVDYAQQLNLSADATEVRALYAQAGLDLNTDLQTLNSSQRIAANQQSLGYLEQNIDLYRPQSIPTLTMHTEGDGLVSVQHESAYRVLGGPASPELRQTFVHRAGHCAFTAGETLAVFAAVIRRLDDGAWSGLTPAELNAEANRLVPVWNLIWSPAFETLTPAPFLRPFYGYPQ